MNPDVKYQKRGTLVEILYTREKDHFPQHSNMYTKDVIF